MERIIRSTTECNLTPVYRTMGQYVWSRLQRMDGQSVCLIDASTDERLTVSELKTRANSIAMALIKRGINKTDKIAFCGQNSIQHSILRFGTYLTGNTALILNHLRNTSEMEGEFSGVDANVIICSEKCLHKFNEILNKNNEKIKLVVIFNGEDNDKHMTYEELLNDGMDYTLDRIPYFDVDAEDIQELTHSSGTTGPPKTVMMSNRMLVNIALNVLSGNSGPQTVGTFLHLSLSVGDLNLYHMCAGNTVVMFDNNDGASIFRAIEKYAIEVLLTYPWFVATIGAEMDANNYDLSSVKMVATGASGLPMQMALRLRNRYGIDVKIGYAMTEYNPITEGVVIDDQLIPGCAGQVCAGTQVKITDLDTGESVGAGIDGEICVRGITMFSGYLNNVGATNEAIDREGWFKTGDIGHLDHKERLFITGRLKELIDVWADNMFKRVVPEEIEKHLMTHKSIAEVVVIGVNNRIAYQSLRAYVVLRDGQLVSAEEIRKYVSESLSSCKQLNAGVVFVDRIRRAMSGKVDRNYYKELVRNEVID